MKVSVQPSCAVQDQSVVSHPEGVVFCLLFFFPSKLLTLHSMGNLCLDRKQKVVQPLQQLVVGSLLAIVGGYRELYL